MNPVVQPQKDFHSQKNSVHNQKVNLKTTQVLQLERYTTPMLKNSTSTS